MYFLNLDILIKQLLPPNWRYVRTSNNNNVFVYDSGKTKFLKALLKPFKLLLNDFHFFRTNIKTKINLTAETIIVENHLKIITGISYGISLPDGILSGQFSVLIPAIVSNKEPEIKSFLEQIVPAGCKYQIIFY